MMNSEELDGFRAALIDRKRQLSEWVEHLREDSVADSPDGVGAISSLPTHLADLASDLFEQETDLQSAERTADEVHDIDEALARLEAGAYGSCERCKRPIPPERLRAIPWVVRCLDCQRAQEAA